MSIDLPITLELCRPMERPSSPYGHCGQCEYVGTDISLGSTCPACGASQTNACGVWPTPEFQEIWDDIVFAWNNERAEIASVAAAMYFEASVFHLIKWGTHWLDPKLNWIGAAFDEIPGNQRCSQTLICDRWN
jgi:RNA polymerase subunit RPABC4/transcription elongation factor Spt4